MTALEALEAFSADRNESMNEILEWPYRRYVKAFSSWQRRKVIEEIENRKIVHIGALFSIIEWKQASDQEDAIANAENYYEMMKNIVWNPKLNQEENEEMQKIEESDSFLKAGKRNRQKLSPASFVGQEEIEEALN